MTETLPSEFLGVTAKIFLICFCFFLVWVLFTALSLAPYWYLILQVFNFTFFTFVTKLQNNNRPTKMNPHEI